MGLAPNLGTKAILKVWKPVPNINFGQCPCSCIRIRIPNTNPDPGEPIYVDPDPNYWGGAKSHDGEKALSCIYKSFNTLWKRETVEAKTLLSFMVTGITVTL